eukprot:856804-Prorocentrum_minimum.AAC.1
MDSHARRMDSLAQRVDSLARRARHVSAAGPLAIPHLEALLAVAAAALPAAHLVPLEVAEAALLEPSH